ncbi:hypothetical protein ACFX1R_032974 [Malus domestica]
MWQLGLTSSQSYPERPGVPNCVYYMRTGFCGYGGRCRYNHPRDRAAVVAAVRATGDYPERVGEPICQCHSMEKINVLLFGQGVQPCTFYLLNGQCKFGSTCKFDHPVQTMRYNLSASSLVDMPVVQYPVGSLLATLAPSSSSSDLRPELLSASKKDTYSTRAPSSGNTSSSSGGLIFSKSGYVSLSDVQLSSQTSSPLSNSRSTRPGGEFRRSI